MTNNEAFDDAETAVCARDHRNSMGASIIAIFLFAIAGTTSLLVVHVYGDEASHQRPDFSHKDLYQDQVHELQGMKAAFLKPRPTPEIRRLQQASPSPPPSSVSCPPIRRRHGNFSNHR